MHVISLKKLRDFWNLHQQAESPLRNWYSIVGKTNFEGFSDLRKTFPSVDKVNELYVFNIGGNNYRLIVAIHFNVQKIFIRHVLTHAEYDRGDWKRK